MALHVHAHQSTGSVSAFTHTTQLLIGGAMLTRQQGLGPIEGFCASKVSTTRHAQPVHALDLFLPEATRTTLEGGFGPTSGELVVQVLAFLPRACTRT